MTFDYDWLVIGSGFGGSVSALRLTEKGYRVGVLEAGKRFGPDDYPKTTWSARRFLWAPAMRCFGIMRMTFFRDAFVLSGAGVGGGSLVYANTLLVPPDRFFGDPRWSHLNDDWRAALRPYYERALRMLGATPAKVEGRSDRLLKEVAEEMGRGDTYHVPTVSVFFGDGPGKTSPDPFFGGRGPERTGCNLCAGCMVGCRYNAKNTLDKNYLYLAEAAGAVVHPETMATDIRPLDGPEGGYAISTYRSTSPWLRRGRRTFKAKHIVLSAGAIGTTQLLFQCRERGSLPGLSGQLGNFVRTNSEAIIGVESMDREADYAHGIAISAGIYPDEDTHIETVRYSEGSDLLSLITTMMTDAGPRWRRAVSAVGTMVRRPGRALRSANPVGWAKRTIILLVMQPVDNYMRFVRVRPWYAPWKKKLQTSNDTAAQILATIPVGNEVARRMAEKIDGVPRAAVSELMLNVPTTAHILGGCAMGGTPDEGVIGPDHQVFGYPGMYVVDGSVISANLGVNPSLTITALAERAMAGIEALEGSAEARGDVIDAQEPTEIAASI